MKKRKLRFGKLFITLLAITIVVICMFYCSLVYKEEEEN